MQVTKSQIITISTLLSKLKIQDEDRKNIILGFSFGRSDSRKDLKFTEAEELIKYLKGHEPKKKLPGESMRKKIISRFHEMGYRKEGKIDMPRVQKTLMKYGYLHKKLNEYSVDELPLLVSQVDQIYNDYLKNVR
jgi:hypothetical protein